VERREEEACLSRSVSGAGPEAGVHPRGHNGALWGLQHLGCVSWRQRLILFTRELSFIDLPLLGDGQVSSTCTLPYTPVALAQTSGVPRSR
jgi:hypothetical protein